MWLRPTSLLSLGLLLAVAVLLHNYYQGEDLSRAIGRTVTPNESLFLTKFWEDAAAGHFRTAPSQKKILSICAITAAEDRWLEEWLTYHTLLGVQHFYLYDNTCSDSAAQKLQPWIDIGLVTLHHMRFDRPEHREGFQWKSFVHCEGTYGEQYDWMSHHDVDEFLHLVSSPARPDVPKKDPSTGRWTFGLHSLLADEPFASTSALIVGRKDFVNHGVGRLEDTRRLVQAQTMRSAYNPSAHLPAKTLIHIGYKTGHVIWNGHNPTLRDEPRPPGMRRTIHNALGSDVTGSDFDFDDSSLPTEPLMFYHYGVRDHADCVEKIRVREQNDPDANNWRVLYGEKLCSEKRIPLSAQDSLGKFTSLNQLVEDKELAHSFPARGTEYSLSARHLWKDIAQGPSVIVNLTFT